MAHFYDYLKLNSYEQKVVVLIDGQNLFYGLKPLGLQERDIKWTDLFQSMLEPGDELIRAYWFRPQRLSDGHFSPEAIRNQIVYKKLQWMLPRLQVR